MHVSFAFRSLFAAGFSTCPPNWNRMADSSSIGEIGLAALENRSYKAARQHRRRHAFVDGGFDASSGLRRSPTRGP